MGYFKKSNNRWQKIFQVTDVQKEKIQKDYGLTEVEIDMMIELRLKRKDKSLKKFIEHMLY